jgi:hypothetical protein
MEKCMQKIIEVEDTDNWSDIKKVNDLLKDGWKVIQMIPMGAYGYGYAARGWEHASYSDSGFASLLLLEKK